MNAPFPYFGGKRRVASLVWQAIGADVTNYVEPFAGSLAVLLARPCGARGIETVNDADGLLSNFWRAVADAPDAVARHADWPVNEADLHARHLWLVGQRESLTERLMGDPEWYDARAAGWWVWGISAWIGRGWCSGDGPWTTDGERIVRVGDAGRGVHRQIPHLGDGGTGIHRQLPHLATRYQGVHATAPIREWFRALSERLRRVRVACGDWSRICGPSVLRLGTGATGVFLDPPYAAAGEGRDAVYAADSHTLAHDVAAWAWEHGDDPEMRIVLAGYDGDYDPPAGWTIRRWKAHGGYGSQGHGRARNNARREVLLLSPHCRPIGAQPSLFGGTP